jgi:trk system potassium uptake protein TrkH
MFIGKKINLSDRIIIKESLNQDSFSGMVELIKRIFKYTFIFELVGACVLAIRFIPEYGTKTGIFYSIFHSISAFCNAGFDIIGANSLARYSSDILINITIMSLIIIGGLGFTVWSDIFKTLKKTMKEKLKIKRMWKEFSLHTKIVLTATLILLVSGTIFIYVLEHNNVTVMANDAQGTKILKSAFQSTTLRTAGFSTVEQQELTTAGKFVSICYMFVGGSPASTAGGIKTTTLSILILCVINFILGKNEINVFKKNISFDVLRRAIVIFAISIFIVIIGMLGLLVSEISMQEELYSSQIAEFRTFSFMDIFFETISAFGTVGLSLNVTAYLSSLGKFIVACLMIIGRVGPITISIALFKNRKEKKENSVAYPKGNVIVG